MPGRPKKVSRQRSIILLAREAKNKLHLALSPLRATYLPSTTITIIHRLPTSGTSIIQRVMLWKISIRLPQAAHLLPCNRILPKRPEHRDKLALANRIRRSCLIFSSKGNISRENMLLLPLIVRPGGAVTSGSTSPCAGEGFTQFHSGLSEHIRNFHI